MVQMRRTVDLDAELETEFNEVVALSKEKPAVVIRPALRAGLPAVASRFQAPRPAGYFADDYKADPERVALESSGKDAFHRVPDSIGDAMERLSQNSNHFLNNPLD
jgi:hypothetical protein